MPTRNLPPQTGAGSARDIYGEFGVDGGYSNAGATDIINPRPKGIWEHLDLMWTGLVGKRSTGRSVDPDEMTLAASRTVTIAGAIALTDERKLIVFNSATAITITLPTLASAGDGFEFQVLNLGAGTVTLDPDGSEQILGAATVDLPMGMSWIVKASGATLGWRVLGRVAIPRVSGAGAVTGGLVTTNSAGEITGIAAATAALPRGYIDGLTLANNATDLTNDIDISAGVCRDTSNSVDVSLGSILVKRLDASWTAGTNAGGRDTGSIADGTWHVWLIQNTTTAAVDALFSLSATAPTVPSGWAIVRRLGAVLRESSALVRFVQYGDEFSRREYINGVNLLNPGTASTAETVIGLPAGIKVLANLSILISNASLNTYALFGDPDGPALATPSATVFHHSAISTATENTTTIQVMTNTSRQILRRFSASSTSNKFLVVANGWRDLRGKDA